MESITSQTILSPNSSVSTASPRNFNSDSPPRNITTTTTDPYEEDAVLLRYELDVPHDSEVEDLGKYVKGGYHPVEIGDYLGDDDRFRVVHKLGFGGYGTVWLCHDKFSKKWRAVKIMQAKVSTLDCADLKALETTFAGLDANVLAANHIQLALEYFYINGPNGRHLCFVLPFLGPDLTEIFGVYGHVTWLMKDICFQLVEAMRFIHSLNLCHGDFRTANILLRLADGVDEWEEEAIMGMLGEPEFVPVRRIDDGHGAEHEPGVPDYLVEPAYVSYGSGACSTEIAVIDFGVSYCAAKPPTDQGTGIPLESAAPEELFKLYDSLGFHTDIWALGVAIARVRFGFPAVANKRDCLVEAVQKLESTMGPMPNPYRTVWKSWNGKFANCQNGPREALEDDGWKDESVFATVNTKRHEELQRQRLLEGRPAHFLQYRMHHPNRMFIGEQDAKRIAARAAANPRVLPGNDCAAEDGDEDDEDEADYMLDETESAQLYDLLMRIFKWHPEQRATLDQIANHEWFGERNRRWQLGASPAPSASARDNRAKRKGWDRLAGAIGRMVAEVIDILDRNKMGREE
ncbi:kinase-like domain-containing protein [Chaetomium strumarium]|uniref:EKC/KEOPS complex subunit BUD32 n=1 Tax=Chaetomium strumarium TaxID=1170767 RepID=A0AAJ0LXW4_9PEZI|nr:kinase-like domain-containing protein [Chaetomium strumarium]